MMNTPTNRYGSIGNYRVVIAHRHGPTARGLELMVNEQDQFNVVGRYATHGEALSQKLKPNIALVDYAPAEGIGLGDISLSASTGVPLLLIGEDISSNEVLLCIRHKATGYLSLSGCEQQLPTALLTVAQGDVYVEQGHVSYLVKNFGKEKSEKTRPLTRREEQVMQLLVGVNGKGEHTVKEVAQVLNLSVKTVEAHKFNIMQKLDVHSKVALVRVADNYFE